MAGEDNPQKKGKKDYAHNETYDMVEKWKPFNVHYQISESQDAGIEQR